MARETVPADIAAAISDVIHEARVLETLLANVSSVTTTTITGTVTQPTASVLGVLSIQLFTTGSTGIWVQADCN